MAEQVISPGVFQNESVPVTLEAPVFPEGAAIVGPTVLGPAEIPTVVTTYSEFKQKFGSDFVSGGQNYTFLTSISAQNYFAQGGQRLLVTRVTSGSFTAATSSLVQNGEVGTAADLATGSVLLKQFIDNQELKFTRLGTEFRFITTDSPLPDDVTTGTEQIYYFESASALDTSGTNLTNKINAALSNNTTADASAPLSSIGNILSASYVAATDTLLISGGITTDGGVTYTPSTGFTSVVTISTGSGNDFLDGSDGSTDDVRNFSLSSAAIGTNTFTLQTIAVGDNQNSDSTIAAGGVFPSGSKDNLRWEITNADTSSGNFTLVIRQGNDRTDDKRVLETFRNVNLDPRSNNFISRRVGSQVKSLNTDDSANPYIAITGEYPNKSKYVVVSGVPTTTPDYLDDDGNVRLSTFTASVPTNQTGSFGAGTGNAITKAGSLGMKMYENIGTYTQGVVADDYTNVINLLKNKDEFPFNIISFPGLISGLTAHKTELDKIINHITSRGDAIIPIDLVEYGAAISTVTTKANDLNTSYAATYWPWVKVRDIDLNKNVWAPAGTIIPSVYASNDQSSDAWFAPAGFTRGALPRVVTTERALKRSLRDTLYSNKVNPIASFPQVGFVVYGQKTLQSAASATDRVNVRRLLIALKKFIGDVSQNLVFEPNTLATRNAFLSVVNPYLETVQQRQGLYAFKVVMDASNNGPQVVDRNELRGAIYLQPTKTAEFIVLDFNVLPTGAEFPS